MRTSVIITIENPIEYKTRLLSWAQQFREIVFLDSNNYPEQEHHYDVVLAVDAFTAIQTDYYNAFKELKEYQEITRDWLFGYLSYDLKNAVEDLKSQNFDGLHFPDLFFFQPKKLFLLKDDQLKVLYLPVNDDEIEQDLENILQFEHSPQFPLQSIEIQQRIQKAVYIDKVNKMLEYIHRGDIYEANFCMEFFAENTVIPPLETYQKLNALSEPPFAVYFKNHKHFLLSASPERYLKKEGDIIISQPIKGTARRNADAVIDMQLRQELESSAKERSENIMIVDLVRNDLSRTAQKSTVIVKELCGVYTFKQVHHLISTITSRLDPKHSVIELIRTTFPMGSMTGAPKIAAMKYIEDLEETRRGLYSGSVGYFTPDNDFDFNVVIRSILYNQQEQYVSFSVGSAITAASIPEKEYEECMVKAEAMLRVLGGS